MIIIIITYAAIWRKKEFYQEKLVEKHNVGLFVLY